MDGSLAELGSFSKVFAARCVPNARKVMLKVMQERNLYMCELHALKRLVFVDGVVILLDFFTCGDGYVLVLPRLFAVNYRDICKSKSESSCLPFLRAVMKAIMDMHAVGLAHCDLKPDAIMMDGKGCPTLIDFNLCRSSTMVCNSLPGTPGWIFDGSPAKTGEEIDRVGLAALAGWMVGIDGFGDPDTDFDSAVDTVRCLVSSKQQRSKVIKIVHMLLTTKVPLIEIFNSAFESAHVSNKENRHCNL